MAGHTATGAGVGAASGAVGGAITGSAGIGAAVGAATGALWIWAACSLLPPDPAYVNVVNQCLAERGYQVAGWK